MAVSRVAIGLLLLWLSAAEARINFKKEIRPLLEQHCVRCHGPSAAVKGLRLHPRERALMAIVPGRPDESRALTAAQSEMMPQGPKELTSQELASLRRWILEGARWPKNMELKENPK